MLTVKLRYDLKKNYFLSDESAGLRLFSDNSRL